MTFAEFWPLYNGVMGNTIVPMNSDDLQDLEDQWVGANG
jgi:hypothetical protein